MGALGTLLHPPATVLPVFLLPARNGVVTGSVIDWDQTVVGGHD